MKLKLTMSSAETGEVLHEETDLDFAMMCFGRKTEKGVDFQGVTRAEELDAFRIANCLAGVDSAVDKNCRENKAVGMAYVLIKMGLMGDSLKTEDMSSHTGGDSTVSAEGADTEEAQA